MPLLCAETLRGVVSVHVNHENEAAGAVDASMGAQECKPEVSVRFLLHSRTLFSAHASIA